MNNNSLCLDRPPSPLSPFTPWVALVVALVLLAALYLESIQQPLWAAGMGALALIGPLALLLVWQLKQQQARTNTLEQRNQLMLQSAFGTGHTGAWRVDLARPDEGVLLSAQAQLIYGHVHQPRLPLEQWLQHARTAPEAHHPAAAVLHELLAQQPDGLDCTYLHHRPDDGKAVWLNDRGLLRRDAQGAAVELVGVVVDITETRLAQEESYRSTTALLQAMDSTQSGTWSVDYIQAPGTMCLSERTQRMLGLPPAPGDLYSLNDMRQHRAAAGHPECVAEALRGYEAVHRGETDIISGVSAWRRPDTGAVIWTHTTGKVRRDAQGKLLNLVGMMRDVTHEKVYELELLHAKQAAESATRAKGDFLANLSHEILTPLNAIIGLSGLGLKGEATPAQRDYLEKIRQSGQHLLGVLNDLLDFSKLESGELEIETLPFALQGVVDTVLHAVAEKAAHKGLELVCSLDPFLPATLLGDPLRIAQILSNFADNAVKFTDTGHVHIAVTLRQASPEAVTLCVAVSDSGMGLTQEQSSRLFRGFTQADASVTRRFGGTGMGLAICKKLAQAMGGNVGVDSRFGKGSTFTLELPLAVGGPGYLACTPNNALQGRRVLVVDDSPLALSVLCDTLAEAGLVVDRRDSTEAALNALQSAHAHNTPWDVVLMDVSMPGMDNWSALRALRSAQIDLAPVVPMAAAHRCAALEPEARLLGIAHLLPKPVLPNALLQTLEQILNAGSAVPNAPEEAGEALHTRLKALRGARLLLVEDNEINQQVACELLRDAGFAVDVADNGQIGLDRVQARHAEHQPYDLVLMDIQMPVMDGITATLALRNRFSAQALPIVALTANATASDRERCKQVGMNDFVGKPVEAPALWRALVQCIAPRPDFAPPVAPVAAHNVLEPDSSALLEALRFVDGLDIARGLTLTNHKPVFYLNMLRKFASAQAGAITQIRTALAGGDTTQAERTAHTLKGLAGTLGATPLHQSAGLLEAQLRTHLKAHTMDTAIAHTQAELDKLLNALHGIAGLIVAQSPQANAPLSEAEQREGAILLARIKVLLEHSNADALDLWQNNTRLLRPLVPKADAIGAAINDFDFDEALSLLQCQESGTAPGREGTAPVTATACASSA